MNATIRTKRPTIERRAGATSTAGAPDAIRDRLRGCGGDVRFLHLAGAPALLRVRMEQREDHFMPAGLLDSQLATLEPAGAGKVICDLHVAQGVETLARTAMELLGEE